MDVNVSMAEIYWHQSDDDAGAAPQSVELFSEGGLGLSSQVLPIICTWQLFLYFSYQNTQILSNLEKKNYYHERKEVKTWEDA